MDALKQEVQPKATGFLHADGTKIVDAAGQEILLSGWALGNWLVLEGYMWKSLGCPEFDRSRRIKKVIADLTDRKYAKQFFERYYETYVTEDDIRSMSELGYNSIRIPLQWNLFLRETSGVQFIEQGFLLLDRVIKWCKTYHLYVFLDLHAAPGGQTGANIDDSKEDIPELFLNQDYYEKGIALWEEIARRYRDEPIIGGYDLLNEPLRPGNGEHQVSYDYLLPNLISFYEDCIVRIRAVDPNHMISIEGHHWATDTAVFHKKYDENSVLHFHRYACWPDVSSYQEFLALSKQYQVPLWMGETGENKIFWYAAMYPLAHQLGIGYNLWPWKKMECDNSPCSIKMPKDWNLIIDFAAGKARPSKKKAMEILEEFLVNMQYQNCKKNEAVTGSVFRRKGTVLCGVDFDEFPGKGQSYGYVNVHESEYRSNTGMDNREYQTITKRFGFDTCHDRFGLNLWEKEFATYTFDPKEDVTVRIYATCIRHGQFMVSIRGEINQYPLEEGTVVLEVDAKGEEPLIVKLASIDCVIRIERLELV